MFNQNSKQNDLYELKLMPLITDPQSMAHKFSYLFQYLFIFGPLSYIIIYL
jgi:hypothetical protein